MKLYYIVYSFIYLMPLLIVFSQSTSPSSLYLLKLSALPVFVATLFSVCGLKKSTLEFCPVSLKKILLLNFIIFFIIRSPDYFHIISSVIKGEILNYVYEKAVERYAGMGASLSNQIATLFFFTYSILLGLVKLQKETRILYYLYIAQLIVIVSDTSRTGMLMSLIFILTSFTFVNKEKIKATSMTRLLYRLSWVGLIIIGIFVALQLSRITDQNDMVTIFIEKKLPSYTLAPFYALDEWFRGYNNTADLGLNSFNSLYRLLTGEKYKAGYYAQVATTIGTTNIFTIIRGIIADFGIVGAIFFYLCAHLIINFLFILPISKVRYIVFIIFASSFLYPIISLYTYTTVLLTFLITSLQLIFIPMRRIE